MSLISDAVLAQQNEEFERVWEAADWMFKNDKQDAKYFFLKGQEVELVKQQRRQESEDHGNNQTENSTM